MKIIDDLAALNRDQRATFIASVLGWTLDAFDFFLMVFVVKAIAKDFHTEKETVLWAVTLTLMFRPLGALFFGRLADRFGRRPILMANILLFSFFELASAFAPSLTVFFILRALFGFAMGGEWGIGSSLVMESIPAQSRGTVSGILQEGYALGYLLAAVVYGLFFDLIGWRGMFVIGVVPALLVFYIRMSVKESPVWEQNQSRARRANLPLLVRQHWKTFLYLILLMTAFTFFSHGTQDLHPTFLQERKLPTATVSAIAIVANIGAIIGGITFGFYSQRLGRRRAIIIASLLALPIIPLWAFSTTPLYLGLGAFLIQIAVQGAWGVIPAHLNELSPEELRGTFPGFAYQLGNFVASSNAVLQGWIAKTHGGDYAVALAIVAAVAAVAVALITALGKEAKGVAFGNELPAGIEPN
jgi:SHS family lactate transporter-like MFS transporter